MKIYLVLVTELRRIPEFFGEKNNQRGYNLETKKGGNLVWDIILTIYMYIYKFHEDILNGY